MPLKNMLPCPSQPVAAQIMDFYMTSGDNTDHGLPHCFSLQHRPPDINTALDCIMDNGHQHGPRWHHISRALTWLQEVAQTTDIHTAFLVTWTKDINMVSGGNTEHRHQLSPPRTTGIILESGESTDHRHQHNLWWQCGPQTSTCSPLAA